MARFGGDELTLLRHDIALENDVALLAERILALLAPAFLADERKLHVTASIVTGLSPDDATDLINPPHDPRSARSPTLRQEHVIIT